MKNIPNPYDSLGNANPNSSIIINPTDEKKVVTCNGICLRFYGNGLHLGGVTITLLDDTEVNFADLNTFDVNDWHWYRFKSIEVEQTSNLRVEIVCANVEV